MLRQPPFKQLWSIAEPEAAAWNWSACAWGATSHSETPQRYKPKECECRTVPVNLSQVWLAAMPSWPYHNGGLGFYLSVWNNPRAAARIALNCSVPLVSWSLIPFLFTDEFDSPIHHTIDCEGNKCTPEREIHAQVVWLTALVTTTWSSSGKASEERVLGISPGSCVPFVFFLTICWGQKTALKGFAAGQLSICEWL